MIKICVITGTRAEYGVLRPLLEKINEDHAFQLSLIITGMHLVKKYGETYKDVIRDNYNILGEVKCIDENEKDNSMANNIGNCILGLANILKKNKQHYLIVIGDRFEMLAASITGIYMNIPIIHIQGGDTSGNVDNSVRDAISKIAHIHFPATKRSAKKLVSLGEKPWRIHIVGALALDSLKKIKKLSKNLIVSKYNLNKKKPIVLLIQHSVTTQSELSSKQIKETFKVILKKKFNTIIIYPNSDTGAISIIKEIEKLRHYSFIRIFKNLPQKDFINILRNVDVIIGNSSCALIEAPIFQIPAVNIGIRQKGREHGNNVINSDHIAINIEKALNKALHINRTKIVHPFGKGDTSNKIINIIKYIKVDIKLIQK